MQAIGRRPHRIKLQDCLCKCQCYIQMAQCVKWHCWWSANVFHSIRLWNKAALVRCATRWEINSFYLRRGDKKGLRLMIWFRHLISLIHIALASALLISLRAEVEGCSRLSRPAGSVKVILRGWESQGSGIKYGYIHAPLPLRERFQRHWRLLKCSWGELTSLTDLGSTFSQQTQNSTQVR